jgi:predicted Abi (CAAX) family protease
MTYHGAVVIMLGLLTGFPYAFVLTGQLVGEERAWRMAHMEGLLNGMLVLLAAALSGALVLSARQQSWLAWSLVVAAYGNVIAATLGATFGVRGLDLAGPAANAVMNLLFWVAIVAVFVGIGLLIVGARAAARAGRT